MIIERENWANASGQAVVDDDGELLRIIGFVGNPAVIMRRETGAEAGKIIIEIMGAPTSERFHLLVRADGQ